jgi:hypothetical protein
MARVIFHHVWAFRSAFVGPCTAPLVSTLFNQVTTLCLMNATAAGVDLLLRVPKGKQQRLTECLLIHTMSSSSVTELFKAFLALYETGVSSPYSPEVRYCTVLSLRQWCRVHTFTTSWDPFSYHPLRLVTSPKRHLSMKSSDQNFIGIFCLIVLDIISLTVAIARRLRIVKHLIIYNIFRHFVT